ncbi:MAG: PAAR domain-containing protein [Spirosoma sp.]|nr:PAAR domain-containing protein [Spirosoma sp.]
MGQPAARVGDLHVCPMVTPGLPPVPHVGGPILPPGMPNVLIGGMPAATVGCMCTCVGPPDVIIKGSFTVLIGGKPAARMGDNTAHGGVITIGFPTVLIGDMGVPSVSFFAAMLPTVLAELTGGMTNQMARTVKQAVALANGAASGKATVEVCP